MRMNGSHHRYSHWYHKTIFSPPSETTRECVPIACNLQWVYLYNNNVLLQLQSPWSPWYFINSSFFFSTFSLSHNIFFRACFSAIMPYIFRTELLKMPRCRCWKHLTRQNINNHNYLSQQKATVCRRNNKRKTKKKNEGEQSRKTNGEVQRTAETHTPSANKVIARKTPTTLHETARKKNTQSTYERQLNGLYSSDVVIILKART